MVIIKVCTEGSCSLKGAYRLFRKLSTLIEQSGMDDKIELSPCGCLKDCNKAGVCVAVGETLYSVHEETAKDFFDQLIASIH